MWITDVLAAAALMVAALILGGVVVTVAVDRVRRRRRAAREDSPLRRALRGPADRPIENPVMCWVPDEHTGGWRLVGSYLPAGEPTAATDCAPPPSAALDRRRFDRPLARTRRGRRRRRRANR